MLTKRLIMFFFTTCIGWAMGAFDAEASKISLLVIDANSYLADRAISGLELPEDIEVRFFTLGEITAAEGGEAGRFIEDSDAIVVDVMSAELVDYVSAQGRLDTRKVFALRGSRDDEDLKRRGFRFDPQVAAYFRHLSVENIRNMIACTAGKALGADAACRPVVERPQTGVYHPDAERTFADFPSYERWYRKRQTYDERHPWVGVTLFSSNLVEGQREMVDDMIRRLESAGCNVLAGFGRDRVVIENILMDERRRTRVDLVLSVSLKFHSAMSPALKQALVDLDVPVFNAINLYSQTIDDWRGDPVGIPPLDVVWTVANPEISAAVEPTPLFGKQRVEKPLSGKEVFTYHLIPENLEHLLPRLKKWARLRRKPNADKRVALLYYNHSQGKQNIGASYLNVFRSIETILDRLKAEGYAVDPERRARLDETAVKELLLRSGRNIGSWAPGELDRLLGEKSVVRVSLDTYREWFAELPPDFREAVLDQWGPPEASTIMTRDGDFIIPAVRVGNLVLMPEPSRGWGDDAMKLYHDPKLYPHHQYIAAYLWLRHGFSADAMIHLGTHATYEWLPGRQVGLGPADAPEVMTGDIPNLYPYIVDDVGEGIQAKRRGRGVIIDHLTPPVKKSGLYREYAQLSELIGAYDRAVARGSGTAPEKKEAVERLIRKLGIDRDLLAAKEDHVPATPADGSPAAAPEERAANPAGEEDADAFLHAVAHYLEEIRETLTPYGLHTFGVSPDGEALDETVAAVHAAHETVDAAGIRGRLSASGPLELERLVRGLEGRYVPPGEGNDPVRNLDAVPTGKNFYGFSPDRVPSPAAWKLGKKAAEGIIRDSLEKKGAYPEKVAVVLWAVETIRNEGVNESTILHLMGMEPVWDRTGRVTGTRVTPGARLKRPRIDVLVNPSGLYRDLFPNLVLFIDNAIQQAAVEQDIANLIARNSERTRERLVASGMDPGEADALSRLRIFGEAPGTYGTGVSEMAGNSQFWESDQEVVDVYQNRVGYAFGGGKWGVPAKQVFRENLKAVDTAVHSISTTLYATMDNDDLFSHLGALSMAVRKERGEAPETLVNLQRRPDEIEVEDVAKTIGRELRTRYLNPRWIEGMQKENYAGARAMSEFMENMWGWQVTTPSAVDAAKWEQGYAVYVEDKYGLDMKAFFNRENPWAYQSMAARMLEAVRKDYWQAAEKVKEKLAVEYAVSVVDKGVACCDHTCNNPVLNQMVVNIISLPGVMSPEVVEQFKLAVEKAAGKTLEHQVVEMAALHRRVTDGFDHKPDAMEQAKGDTGPEAQKAADTGDRGERVEGYKMEEMQTADETTELASSGVQWFASLAILTVIALFVAGTRRRS